MKQICIVICLFFVTVFGAIAQSKGSLEVIGNKGQKSKLINEGTRIHEIINGKKYKGDFKILSNQAILINSDTILVSQIQGLSANTTSTQFSGLALIVPGSIIGGVGIVATVAGIIDGGGYGTLGVVMGVPLAGIGIFGVVKGIQLLSNGKRFPSSKWKYKINIPSN